MNDEQWVIDFVGRARSSTPAVIVAAIGGAMAGAILGWFVILTEPFNHFSYAVLGALGLSFDAMGATGPLVPWILMGLLVVAGIAVALTWLFLAAGKSLRLALTGTGLAAVGSSVGLVLAMSYGHSTDYSNDSGTILIEIALVPAGCAVALALGRRILSPPARSRQ